MKFECLIMLRIGHNRAPHTAPLWLEAEPSVGELIPGHPLSVGERAREGGECKRGRETKLKKKGRPERKGISIAQ